MQISPTNEPCGLTVDGVPVPLSVEAAGGDAIDAYVLDQLTTPSAPAPSVAEGSPTPPTDSEGAEL